MKGHKFLEFTSVEDFWTFFEEFKIGILCTKNFSVHKLFAKVVHVQERPMQTCLAKIIQNSLWLNCYLVALLTCKWKFTFVLWAKLQKSLQKHIWSRPHQSECQFLHKWIRVYVNLKITYNNLLTRINQLFEQIEWIYQLQFRYKVAFQNLIQKLNKGKKVSVKQLAWWRIVGIEASHRSSLSFLTREKIFCYRLDVLVKDSIVSKIVGISSQRFVTEHSILKYQIYQYHSF